MTQSFLSQSAFGMTWSTFCYCRRPPWTSCLSGWCLAVSRRLGTIRSTSGSGIHGCIKEIRDYPLYIWFRYSSLPQGDLELSALHPVQVFKTALRRSGTSSSTPSSDIHGFLKEISNYPLYIRFGYSLLPQGDQELPALHPVRVFIAASRRSGTILSTVHPVQVFMADSRRSGTIRPTSGSGIHGCLKEIRNYLHPVQVLMAAPRRLGIML